MTRAVVALLVFTVILISPFIVAGASGQWGSAETKPDLEPGISEDAGDRCVGEGTTDEEVTEWMRVNHMVLLKDERVQAVRHGDRTEKDSIEKCFSCHEFEKFCKECHEYNGVQPTCFDELGGCHSSDPYGGQFPEDHPEGF